MIVISVADDDTLGDLGTPADDHGLSRHERGMGADDAGSDIEDCSTTGDQSDAAADEAISQDELTTLEHLDVATCSDTDATFYGQAWVEKAEHTDASARSPLAKDPSKASREASTLMSHGASAAPATPSCPSNQVIVSRSPWSRGVGAAEGNSELSLSCRA